MLIRRIALSRIFWFALLAVIALSSCAKKTSLKYNPKLAKIVKQIPSKMNCKLLGVVYGRASNKRKALYDLRVNTARNGGTHVIITESETNNKDEFTVLITVTSTYVLGDGYTCPKTTKNKTNQSRHPS